jgi:hypothetical protein
MYKPMSNIENMIFNDALPVNPKPMVSRLEQLINENFAENKDWKQDTRIERLLYLILVTWEPHLQLGDINFQDWYAQLTAQREA